MVVYQSSNVAANLKAYTVIDSALRALGSSTIPLAPVYQRLMKNKGYAVTTFPASISDNHRPQSHCVRELRHHSIVRVSPPAVHVLSFIDAPLTRTGVSGSRLAGVITTTESTNT